MQTIRTMGAAATLAAVLAAAGCSGSSGGATSSSAPSSPHSTKAGTKPGIASGEPAPPTTGMKSSSKASSATSTPSSSGTAAGAPGVPEAARQHTKAGANMFVKYYLGLINETALHPKAGVLEPLATASCKSCDNYERTVANLVEEDRRFSGPELTVLSVKNIGYQGSSSDVEAHVQEHSVDIVEKSGETVKSFPSKDDDGVVFKLSWQNGWRVAAVQPISQ